MERENLLDAVVDMIVHPLIREIDFRPQIRRVQVYIPELLRQQRIKLAIQHADNLTALVIDDRVQLFIPQHRDREAAGIMRVRGEIQLAEILEFRM